MKSEADTAVRVSKETRLKLYRLKEPGQTYDNLINKLIDERK
jgi:hypothetical protein